MQVRRGADGVEDAVGRAWAGSVGEAEGSGGVEAASGKLKETV